jgi:CheY-like chemotaxis protein
MGINMKALVLEDNGRVIELYKKIFSEKGCDADFVRDSTQCLEYAQIGGDYDFVVLENPTKAGGANLEDRLRNVKPQRKVFFLSPYMSKRKEGFEHLKDTLDLIDKPFAMISLLSYIEIKDQITPNTL